MHKRLSAFAFLCVTALLPAGSAVAWQQEEAAAGQEGELGPEANLLERLERLGENFQELRRQIRDGLAQEPAGTAGATEGETDYHLTALSLAGEVDGKTVRFEAELRAIVDREGRFGVPLNQFATLESVEPSGSVIATDEGYLWRVAGKGEHEVRMKFSVPLLEPQVGSRQLRMPVVSRLASPVSLLRLTVPGDRVEARNGNGQQLRVLPAEPGWVIEWNGLPHEGYLSVEWQRRVQRPQPPRLQSEVAWLVEVQSQRAVTQATVSLQSRGSEFDQFQIQLPPGIEHLVWEVAGEKSTNLRRAEDAGRGDLLSVLLENPTSGPVRVRLSFEQPIDAAGSALVLRGLEIPGALSQGGHLLLHSADDLEIVPADSDTVQEIALEDLPSELKGGRGGVAFRYLRQPFALPVRLRPRRALIAVEPSISLLLVRKGEDVAAVLHSRWVVSVQHAPIEELAFDLAGWQTSVGALRGVRLGSEGGLSEQLVDPQASEVNDSGRLNVRLSRPVQEPFVIAFDAQRALGGGQGVRVELPVALDDPVSDSRVALFTGEGLRVRPQLEAMPEVLPDYFPSDSPLPVLAAESRAAGPPQVLRVRDARQPLSLDLELLPAVVQAGCRSRITLRTESALVEQHFSFLAQNAPLSELLLDVPFALVNTRVFASALPADAQESPFEQLLIGQLRRLAVEADPATNESVWRVGVNLAQSPSGRFDWKLRYEIPLDLEVAESQAVGIPLVMPVADTLTHNEVEVRADPAVQVMQGETQEWRVADGAGPQRPLWLRADARAFSVPLLVSGRSRFLNEPAVIRRAWIRTSIEPSGLRRYQGVYRLETDRPYVSVKFPAGALRPSVRVDGRAARFETAEDGAYRVFLSAPEEGRGSRRAAGNRYLVVVEYSVSASRRLSHWNNVFRLEAPWFGDARWEDRWYWQVLVPKQQHLFTQSASYYPELQWRWLGAAWGRVASRTTDELNRWMQSDLTTSDFAASTNEYLFSRIGADAARGAAPAASPQGANPTLTLRTVTPPLLLLFGSGAVCLFGLLFVSWAAARSLAVVLGAAFCAMIAASLYPLPAVLLLQAAAPGLVLVGVAALLRWNVWRHQQRGVLVPAERSSILTIPSTMAPHQAEAAGSVGSTRTGARSGVGGLQ